MESRGRLHPLGDRSAMTRISFATITLFLAFVVSGCNTSKEPETADVSGKVELDGKRLPSGKIVFEQTGLPPDTLDIQEGEFKGKAKVGTAKVRINSYRQGKVPDMYKDSPNKEQFMENIIPPTFNTNSKLTADIKSGKNADLAFSVKSKS
jgi:hypothetical protein